MPNEQYLNEVEIIISFINSFYIDEISQKPVDLLESKSFVDKFFLEKLHLSPDERELARIHSFRDDLRTYLNSYDISLLNKWFSKMYFSALIDLDEDKNPQLSFSHRTTTYPVINKLLLIILNIILKNNLNRIKKCPECKWVFYDKTKNGSKVFCSLISARDGKACGTTAKVRRWRYKQKVNSN